MSLLFCLQRRCENICVCILKAIDWKLNLKTSFYFMRLVRGFVFSSPQDDLCIMYSSAALLQLRSAFAYEYTLGHFGHARRQGGSHPDAENPSF